jgi:hypothetical protein
VSPRLVQLSQGCPRLHFSLQQQLDGCNQVVCDQTHFLCLQGPHERGIRFLLRTTRNWPLSGDAPVEELVVGGVGVMTATEYLCDNLSTAWKMV